MRRDLLNCYCDHCANNTCSTNRLCYAEWKLVSAGDPRDQPQSTPLSSPAATTLLRPTSPSSSAPLSPSIGIKLEKSYNCFKKDDPLLIRTVCNETATNTSHVIRRCCQTSDYCNTNPDLLPSESEAIEEFRRYLPSAEPSRYLKNHNDNILAGFYDQYSNLPLVIQVSLVVFITLSLVYLIALAQGAATRRRRRRQQQITHSHSQQPRPASQRGRRQMNTSNASATTSGNTNIFKRYLNRLLFSLGRRASSRADNDSQRSNVLGDFILESTNVVDSRGSGKVSARNNPFAHQHRHHNQLGSGNSTLNRHDTDLSENSSGRANSEMAVFDTNSTASREPLINHRARILPSGVTIDNMAVKHAGPILIEESVGRTQSTFQMTLGSAADDQYKLDSSSGSGSGQPYLTQRSIANDIQLIEIVGRGYFGVVWRGEYKGEPVAVKVFSPVAEPSWEREAEIYQTTMLRHKNILGFIATDKRLDGVLIGYWLVTDYYPMGSLYDFLRDNTMAMTDAIRMAFSIANGLSHLHIEIFGTKGKPAIAHRDLKSKNILVKNDGTCCIADLGMAVRYNSHTGIVDVPASTRIGTRRYLAPEILDRKLNLMDFESVKAPDIYALGLVLWEILRRTCLFHPSAQLDPNFNSEVLQQTAQLSGSTKSDLSEVVLDGSLTQITRTEAQAALNRTESNAEASASQTNIEPVKQQQSTGTLTSEVPGSAQGSQSQPLTQPPQTPPQQSAPSRSQASPQRSVDSVDPAIPRLAIVCEPYEPPYGPHAPTDPSAEDMRQVVCVMKLRPELSPRWNKFASMRDYVNLMNECWYDKPQARLSALRVRKSLSDVAKKHFNMNLEYD